MKRLTITLFLVLTPFAFAQEAEAPQQIAVTGGEATVENVKFPVFGKVATVEKGQFGGIRYTVTEANAKAALKKAEQIKKFYQGRKIAGAKIGAFKKINKPDTIAWAASGKKGAEAVGVVIKVEEASVVIYVLPGYEESVQAMIL